MSNIIRICSNHRDRPTPLIWTFAFPGAEYWCPHCGYTSGMLGAGEAAINTPYLTATLEADTLRSTEYLRARSTLVASRVLHQGQHIQPENLPPEIKAKNFETIQSWRYGIHDRTKAYK